MATTKLKATQQHRSGMRTMFLLLVFLSGCLAPATGADEEQPPVDDLEPDAPALRFHRAAPLGGSSASAAPWSENLSVVVRPTGFLAFEPTLGSMRDGTVLASALEKSLQAPDPDLRSVIRSRDGGATWQDVTPRIAATNWPPTSGDPYLHVDPDTGRTFVSQLEALVCSTLSISDDGGDTWTHQPLGCGHPVGLQDKQTLFTAPPRAATTVGYPNLVYYCVNRIADTACATSLDGGLTFGPLRPLVYQGYSPDEGLCGGLTGHGVTAPDGRVYLPKVHCNVPTVAISDDDGLTWTHSVVSEAMPTGTSLSNGASYQDVLLDMAVDGEGNVYVVWVGHDRAVYMGRSFDAGASWQPPVRISPDDMGTAAFPMMTAGDLGRVAVGYIAASSGKDYDEMENNDTWHGYLVIAADAREHLPLLATLRVNPESDPLARGVCGGQRCGHPTPPAGYRGAMGDFLDLTIDTEGRPWAAFVDVCQGSCIAGGPREGAELTLATLATGPSLRGGQLAPLET